VTAPAPAVAGGGLTAAQIAALIALIEAQARVRGQLTDTAKAAAVAAFAAITDWWSSDQISKAVTASLKVVQSSQRSAARITDAYLVRAAQTMTGGIRPSAAGTVDVTQLRRAIPAQVASDLVSGRRQPPFLVIGDTVDGPNAAIDDRIALSIPDPGATTTSAKKLAAQRSGAAAAETVDPGDAYGRVADGYRLRIITRGTPEERARSYALARVEAVAQTDVTLAVREQVRKTLTKIKGVRGYRRILRPELSESGPCGLCVVAADRVYHVEDLKPIHDRCVCEVLPIIGDLDPGLSLNAADLERLYAAAGGTGAAGLKRIRVAVAEHGELGPVLVDADHHYRGPVDVAKTVVRDPKIRARAELDALDVTYASLVRRKQAGENVDRPLEWQTRRIAQLHAVIAG
jgi:hypothetical protein